MVKKSRVIRDAVVQKRRVRVAVPENADKQEIWSIEYLVDRLSLRLVSIKQPIEENGITVQIRKYVEQARHLMWGIPVANPAPAFVVELSDLSPRLIAELRESKERGRRYVLTQAVGRLFEEVDYEYYHLSVARYLLVALK